jgi:hypothetical protein
MWAAGLLRNRATIRGAAYETVRQRKRVGADRRVPRRRKGRAVSGMRATRLWPSEVTPQARRK